MQETLWQCGYLLLIFAAGELVSHFLRSRLKQAKHRVRAIHREIVDYYPEWTFESLEHRSVPWWNGFWRQDDLDRRCPSALLERRAECIATYERVMDRCKGIMWWSGWSVGLAIFLTEFLRRQEWAFLGFGLAMIVGTMASLITLFCLIAWTFNIFERQYMERMDRWEAETQPIPVRAVPQAYVRQ